MERAIAFYRLDGAENLWMKIVERFGENITPSGTVYFRPEEARAETEFGEFCLRNNIQATKKTILEHSGSGAFSRPFYFLGIKDSRDYNQEFIEFACDGGGKGLCWRGATQVRKVSVSRSTAEKVSKNGIMLRNYPISPRVYLVSRQLKDLLEQAAFTGLNFVPCLNVGEAYSAEDVAVGTSSACLENGASCFQMVISKKTVGNPSIGDLIVASKCPRCGAASILEGTQHFHFRRTDLGDSDFQCFSDVVTANVGQIPMVGEVGIISGKALQFLRHNDVKGLKAYLTDPPIRFAAVTIET